MLGIPYIGMAVINTSEMCGFLHSKDNIPDSKPVHTFINVTSSFFCNKKFLLTLENCIEFHLKISSLRSVCSTHRHIIAIKFSLDEDAKLTIRYDTSVW